MEYLHHGDALVPRQQRFGQYTRSLMKALGVPVMNQYGLRPALVKGTTQIAPLTISKDLDKLGLLNGVTTFNFHPHLPHYALTTDDTKSVHVLTRQPIDLGRPHPFTEAGNTEFNTCIWMPANYKRCIVHNESHHPHRQASNLAHEISHTLLEHEPTPVADNEGQRYWDPEVEEEASWLGAALLVPREGALVMLKAGCPIERIALHFAVSDTFCRWRIRQSGIDKQAERWRRYWRK